MQDSPPAAACMWNVLLSCFLTSLFDRKNPDVCSYLCWNQR
uniref:Uncharacterized protein n=1 Tax=Arundo donax TaxID=35708 RepID=A0A0A9B1F4_ARUDO